MVIAQKVRIPEAEDDAVAGVKNGSVADAAAVNVLDVPEVPEVHPRRAAVVVGRAMCSRAAVVVVVVQDSGVGSTIRQLALIGCLGVELGPGRFFGQVGAEDAKEEVAGRIVIKLKPNPADYIAFAFDDVVGAVEVRALP